MQRFREELNQRLSLPRACPAPWRLQVGMETWSSTKSAEIPFQHLLSEVQAPHPLPHPAAEAKIPPASPNWSRASPERGTRARKPLIVRRGQKMKSSMEMSGMQPQPTPQCQQCHPAASTKMGTSKLPQKSFSRGKGTREVLGAGTEHPQHPWGAGKGRPTLGTAGEGSAPSARVTSCP